MVDYVEDPIGRIVGVHWDDRGDGGGIEDYPPDPCGQFYLPNAAPFNGCSRWFMGVYQPYLLGMAGYGGLGPFNAYVPVGDHDPGTSATDEYDLYYWGNSAQTGYMVTMEVGLVPEPPPVYNKDDGSVIPPGDPWYRPIGIDVYYDIDPSDVTPNTPPSQTVTSNTLLVQVRLETNRGIPIISCWGGAHTDIRDSQDSFGRHVERGVPPEPKLRTRLTIQSFCEFQTSGAPPPQPGTDRPPANGWIPILFYPPSPPDPRQPSAPPGAAGRAASLATPPAAGLTTSRQRAAARLITPRRRAPRQTTLRDHNGGVVTVASNSGDC